MTADAPAILVVANPDEGRRVSSLLTAAGMRGLLWGDGGDDTLTLYEELEPSVVVLCAALERGDSRALATAIRGGSRGAEVKIVLIGESGGPIRNALDAADYAVDRFVGQPLSPKALAFAVRSCLAATHRPSTLPLPTAVLPERIAEASATTVDAFVRDALHLVPGGTPRAATVEATDRVDRGGPELAEGAEDLTSEAELEGDADAHEPPNWREQTLVLSDGGASMAAEAAAADEARRVARQTAAARRLEEEAEARAAAAAGAAAARAAADPDDVDDSDAPALVHSAAPESDPRGAFARELRRKMSLMAERLFPDQAAAGRVDVGVAHDPHTEIDLTSIGGDPVTGITHEVGPYAEIGDADTFAETDPRAAAAMARTPTPAPGQERTVERTGERREPDRPREERTAEGSDADAVTGTTRRRRDRTASRGVIDGSDHDVASVIARFYRDRFTGQVHFRRDETDKVVHFDDGRPAFATSNRPHDRMGELLFREGKITREQHTRSRELVAESGRRVGEILVELGYLKRRELLPAVRRHVEDIVYSLFAWRSGEYEAVGGECAPGEKIRLSRHPAAIVVEGIRRKYDLEALQARLGSASAVVTPRSREAVQAVVADVDLSPVERQVVELIDGERTLAEVAAAGGDLLAAYHVAFGLVALDAADAQRGPITAVPREEPVRAPSLVGATDLAIDRQRVLAKFSLVNDADYFLLLGVRRDASGFEIRRAYEAARRDYAPDSFPVEIRRELATHIDLINRMLEEAFQVLRTDRVRSAYLANLRD